MSELANTEEYATEEHPLLRKRDGKHAAVTNEELFFDLVYVFAVTQLSHKLLEELTGWGAGETLVLWFALWLGWQYTAWTTNWFNPERMPMRICLLILMALALLMASSISEAFGHRGGVFAGCYVGLQLGRSGFLCTQLGTRHELSKNHLRIFSWFLITTGLWIGGACVGHNLRFALWIVAVCLEFTCSMFGFWLPFLGRSNAKTEWTIEGGHLTERCQLFVIISLGESLISSGSALIDAEEWGSYTMATFFSTLIGTIGMWWLYFGTSTKDAHHRITTSSNPGLIGAIYHYTHAVLILGIIVTAVGDDTTAEGPHHRAEIAQMVVISVGPIIYLSGSICYKFVVYGSIAISHVVGIVFLGAIMPLGLRVNMLAQNWLVAFVFFFVCAWEHLTPQREVDCPAID